MSTSLLIVLIMWYMVKHAYQISTKPLVLNPKPPVSAKGQVKMTCPAAWLHKHLFKFPYTVCLNLLTERMKMCSFELINKKSIKNQARFSVRIRKVDCCSTLILT